MICLNPDCGKRTNCFSQPNFPGTKIAAGNLLLSFGILGAATSATRVFRVFEQVGMACVSLTTFFKYQQVSMHTLPYMVDVGDGCHDSMSHSAKFCAYTVFCCTVPHIIHFELIQVCYRFILLQYKHVN